MEIIDKVRKYIEQKTLFETLHTSNNEVEEFGEGCLHLVALSGGADSVCLLRMMKELGYRIEAVHCNFNLRGEESKRDELFCENLCMSQNVPFHRIHFATTDYAELHKVSIEMAARELRYSYFERLREVIGADDILVAHHRDDNIETFFLNIIRGTGIHGVDGIKPRNGRIIRPLLCLSRTEILEYLDFIGQDYIIDSSNLVDDIQRNRLRLNIIPLLKTVNPAALDNIQKSIEHFSEAVNVYDDAIARSKDDCFDGRVLSLPTLRKQPSPESTFFEILKDYGFSGSQTEQIYSSIDAPTGRVWQTGEWTVAKDRDNLIIDRTPESLPEMIIPETGIYTYRESRTFEHGEYSNVSTKMELSFVQRTVDFKPSREPFLVTLDADKVRFPLTLRAARGGDVFQPYGMKGRKLISDYLTDCKANYFERQQQLVLEDASGTIVWLTGRRTSQKVSIDKDTINVLLVRYFTDKQESL